MKLLKPALLGAVLFGNVSLAMAQEFGGDDMNGFIGVGYGMANLSNNYGAMVAAGSRSTFNLEFGRLSSNVELELNYASGLGYNDLGGRFKVVRPIPIPESGSRYVLIPGLGVAASHSSSGLFRLAADPQKTGFTDIVVGPDLRFMYDMKFGLAVALDFHYDFLVQRNWSDGTPKSESTPKQTRMYFGVTLMVDSRLIE